MFGKWHLGDREGRYPKDRGFDEWFGIPRTTNESMFSTSPGFDPSVVELPYVMEGRKGEPEARQVGAAACRPVAAFERALAVGRRGRRADAPDDEVAGARRLQLLGPVADAHGKPHA